MPASKFNAEVRGALLERFAAGLSVRDAARAVEVREKTVRGWLTRGRRERKGPYADFAAAVERARQAAKSRPEPMNAAELERVVSEMARKGSVSAAELRWKMLTREGEKAGAGEGGILDELEAKRRARA